MSRSVLASSPSVGWILVQKALSFCGNRVLRSLAARFPSASRNLLGEISIQNEPIMMQAPEGAPHPIHLVLLINRVTPAAVWNMCYVWGVS